MPSASEIALAETIRRLTEQTNTLHQQRSSGGTVLSAATIGTAFLAGTGLEDHEGLPWLGWFGVAGVVASAVLVLMTLRPLDLGVGTDVNTLELPEWQSLEDSAATLQFAKYLAKRADENRKLLQCRWRLLSWACGSTVLSILSWVSLIAWR